MKHQPRTWEEQQAYERAVRKRWLQELADMGTTQAEAARVCGLNRDGMLRMARRHGVKFKSRSDAVQEKREAQEAEAKAARLAAKEAKHQATKEQQMRAELTRRTSKLIAEGYSQSQALRAVAHQMGISL